MTAKNSITKRMGAVALAAVLSGSSIMGVITPAIAYAAPITVDAGDNSAGASQTYTAWAIFTGTASGSTLSNVEWAAGFDSTGFLAAIKADSTFGEGTANVFANATTAAEVAEAMAGFQDNGSEAKQFALLAYQHKGTQSGVSLTDGKDDGTGNQVTDGIFESAEDVASGYYVITSTNAASNETQTLPILQVTGTYSATAGRTQGTLRFTPKVSTTTDEKKVGSDTGYDKVGDATIGDNIPYTLTTTLPSNLADYRTFHLNFEDNLSEGLTLQANSVVVTLTQGGVTYTINPDSYGLTTSAYSATDYELVVNFANLKNELAYTAVNGDAATGTITAAAGATITVSYNAKLNEKAVVGEAGNPNTFHVNYSRDPNADDGGDFKPTPDETVTVFTYELDNTKIDGDEKTVLGGAKFLLQRTGSNGTTEYAVLNASKQVIGWTTNRPTDAAIAAATATTTSTMTVDNFDANTAVASIIVSDTTDGGTKGTFNIIGLDAGTYGLLEVQAPDGYNLPSSAFSFTISRDLDNNEQEFSNLKVGDKAGNDETGVVTQDIENKSGSELPHTGGMGTAAFTAVGVALMAGAITITVKRRSNEQ